MAIFPPRQDIPPPTDDGFEPYSDQPYDQGYDPNLPPMGGFGMGMPNTMPYPNQSAQLLTWLLNFRTQVTTPLRHLWAGEQMDIDGNWIVPEGGAIPIMNEKGITWCISLIESYINPVYMMSNYAEKDLFWSMRQLGRVVYNNLAARYKEFGMTKLDITRVGNEVVSKVHAILLSSQNNGMRLFLSSSHQSHEVISQTQQDNNRGGGLLGLRNFFTR